MQVAVGRHDAGQRGPEEPANKKLLTPAAMEEALAHLQACPEMSECRIIGADRRSMRYRSARGDDAELREKLES